jgi:S-sulfo-L-cysteine synthase (O-acetyl-L-serine-dependent)
MGDAGDSPVSLSSLSGSKRYESVFDLVGHTPLVRLGAIDASFPNVEIWAKLEFLNPGGSVKDRPAANMIRSAEQSGALRPGMAIIDSTSGNTGVALALYGAAGGYPVTLVMPSNVSTARKHMVRAFGASIIFSDPMDGSDGAIRLVRKIVTENPGKYHYTNQYGNDANWQAHFRTTGPEILESIGSRLTHFVAGVGTSGTLMGTGRALKAHRQTIQIVGVEPDDEFHGLEGLKHIATSIVPGIYDPSVLDRTVFVDTDDGWNMAERLGREEGLLVGHSSGGILSGAVQVAKECVSAQQPAVIVSILCDHASRYVEARPPME